MINVQTMLKVADNSGAIYVLCIRLLNISMRLGALPGQTITVVVKDNIVKENIKKSKEIKKGQICKALILRTVYGVKRWGNFFLRSGSNCVTIINKFFLPFGTRIFGPIFREVRYFNRYKKLISIGPLTL